jgi:hypothetical protein
MPTEPLWITRTTRWPRCLLTNPARERDRGPPALIPLGGRRRLILGHACWREMARFTTSCQPFECGSGASHKRSARIRPSTTMSSSSILASPSPARRRRRMLVAPVQVLDRVLESRELTLQAGDHLVWSENGICMSLRWFHHSSVLAIMGFETPKSFRPIPLSADRRFRVDESTPTAGH